MLKKLKWIFTKIFYKKNIKKYVSNQFEYIMGYKLNLENPKTFNEKINWIKFNYYNPLYETCSDKIEVRNYVKEKGLSNILTKLYGIYDNFEEIKFEKLPNSFVIKASNGSGGIVVVNDKSNINKKKIKRTIKVAQKYNFYEKNGEWQYKNLKPRILIEEKINSSNPLGILDYKIFCFSGKAEYIYVSTTKANGNDGNEKMDFYDREWNHLNVFRKGHKSMGIIDKPKNYEKMIEIAEILSRDFEHVRVDLYNENGKIYFGELTFTTGAGYGKFEPDNKFDMILGEKFNIENLKN